MKQGSMVTTLCDMASYETEHERFLRMAKEEFDETGTVRYRLTPHGHNGNVTHWHLRHIRSNILFIKLGSV